MANRSLFSPFSSGVNPYATRGLGNLFGPRLKANPEFLNLIAPGPQPSNEMLMAARPFLGSGGLFGSGKRMADLANLQYLAPLIQANFQANLGLEKEKELIPFRSKTELQQRKDEFTFKNQQENKLREEEESRFGSSLGTVAGSFSPEQIRNIFPTGTAFSSPAEQGRAFRTRFGEKTPFNEAIVQADPRVIQAAIGELMGKEFLPLGSGDRFNPRTGTVIEGPGVTQDTTKGMVATGETEPYFDANGDLKYRQVYKEQIRTINRPTPATQYPLPEMATQAKLDAIPKESGANVSGEQYISTDIAPTVNPIQAQPGANIAPKDNVLQSLIKGLSGATKKQFAPVQGLDIQGEMDKMFQPKGKKVEKTESKEKERAKSYPFDYLIEANKLDKNQAEMFESLVDSYKKKEKKNPSLEEARAFIQIVIKK